jgi:fluoride exporter
MKPWLASVLVFLGAGVGANARYWIGLWAVERWGSTFPWPTLVVNLSGSFLIGVFVGVATRLQWGAAAWLLLAIGLLGGYTTFSTFSFESLSLLREARYGEALWSIGLNVVLGLLLAWTGLLLSNLAVSTFGAVAKG